jgi:MFS family permease
MWKMPKLRPPVRSNREGYFIVILTMGFLIQLTALGFGRFAYTAILPSMKTDLGLTNTHMGFFQVAILTGYLLFAYLSGALVKRWSLTVTINLSVALVGIAMTALGFFSSFPLLLLLAFLIGSGAAGSYIPLIPLLIGWSSTKRSGGAIGFALSGTGVGILLVGYAAPLILTRYGLPGWRYAWIILGIVSLLIALAGVFLLRENDRAQDDAMRHNTGDAALSLLYRDPALRTILTVYTLVGFGYITYATFIVAYAVEEVRFSTHEAGLIWSIFGLFSVIGCLFWGLASDRLGRKNVTVVALFLLCGSILLSVFWKEKAGLNISAALFAFSFNGVITLIAAMFGDHIPISKMGRFFGVSTLIHGLGQAISVAIAGWLKDLTATFVVPFLLSALMIGVCPVILMLMNVKGKRETFGRSCRSAET